MSDRVIKVCEYEFDRCIKLLLADCRVECAVATCLRKHPVPSEYVARLLDLLAAAIRAHVWFAKEGPGWCQPLPLTDAEQENILCSGDLPRHLVVYYVYSLKRLDFRYLDHPLLLDYGRGVLAHPDCPNYLQGDRETLAQFPPKPLPGLDGIKWSPPPLVRTEFPSKILSPLVLRDSGAALC